MSEMTYEAILLPADIVVVPDYEKGEGRVLR